MGSISSLYVKNCVTANNHLEGKQRHLMQGRKCSIMPALTFDDDMEEYENGAHRRQSRKVSLQPQSYLLSSEYKRRQSRKFSRSEPLHSHWYQTEQNSNRRISQISINQNNKLTTQYNTNYRTSISKSVENNRFKRKHSDERTGRRNSENNHNQAQNEGSMNEHP